MLSGNFRKNLLTQKSTLHNMTINKNSIFKNQFFNKGLYQLGKKQIDCNKQIENFSKKYFSRNTKRNIFERLTLNDDFESSGKKILDRSNKKLQNQIYYNQDFVNENENKSISEKYYEEYEKKLDNIIEKTENFSNNSENSKNLFNLIKTENYPAEEQELDNLHEKSPEDFKKFISSSIHLPKTDFSERLNIKETELNQLNKITEDYYITQLGIFEDNQLENNLEDIDKIKNINKKNKLWITHDVPSNPLGAPHLNQLMNKILKDAINRLKNLQGYRVIYKPGFDCYGLNIENYIFRKINKKKFKTLQDLLDYKFNEMTNQLSESEKNDEHRRFDLSKSKLTFFREQCRNFIEEYILSQKEYFKRLGIMSYYNFSYTTWSKNYEKKQLDYFQELYERGQILRDYRKILWSETSQKVLELSEVEEKTEMNQSLVIKFPLIELTNDLRQIKNVFPEKDFFFLGFLTEPFKYVGVQALSINDDADYCIAELSSESKELIICSYKRFPEICKRTNSLRTFKVHFIAKGWAFKNLIAKDPIFQRKLLIISMSSVSVYYGTGIDLICPSNDKIYENEEENHIPRKFNLSMQGYIDENNNFCRSLGMYFYNTNVFVNGNKKIISKLNSLKSLLLSYEYENKFYVSKATFERISIRSISSWFLKIDDNLKNKCMNDLAFVKFYPNLNFEEMKMKKKYDEKKLKYSPSKKRKIEDNTNIKDYFNVIEELDNITEWCISDVNCWGIPIPYFINIETKSILLNSEIINHIKNLFYEFGSDIWFSWNVQELLPERYKKDSDKYITGNENFDSLFNSALSWFNSENFTEEEKDVLKEFERLRRMKYVRELNEEFLKIKTEIENRKIKSKDKNFGNRKSNFDFDESQEVRRKNDGQFIFPEKTDGDIKGFNQSENNEKPKEEKIENIEPKENIIKKIREISKTSENSDLETQVNQNVNYLNNEYLISDYNFDNLKDIIPKPLLLEHLSEKAQILLKILANFNSISNSNIIYDIIIEGKNHHSLWILMSSLSSVSFSNFITFKTVLTHGYVLDTLGKDISEKNFKDALDIIDGTIKRFTGRDFGNGADSLRLYFLRNASDNDYKLYEEDILKSKGDIKFLRKISKICLGLLSDYDINKIEKNLIKKIKVNLDELDLIDQIMYYEFVKYYKLSLEMLENYKIAEFIKLTFEFLKNIFHDYYLDSAKFIIIYYDKNDFRRLVKQFILKEIFFNITKLLYPIIPFTTEDIYSHIYFIKGKGKYLGLDELCDLKEIEEKLNLKLTDFQRINFEFKSKNLLQIKNKFLYFFSVIVEKANLKNKLKDSEYINHESESYEFNKKDEEKININDLQEVDKKIKMLQSEKRKKLKVNLIENDPYAPNKMQDLVLYKDDSYASAISNYDSNIRKIRKKGKRFYVPKLNEIELILTVKNRDCYEFQLFNEMEEMGLLESYFGVAKCYMVIEREGQVNDPNNIQKRVNEALREILEDKEILTEAEFTSKNEYKSQNEGNVSIKLHLKMTIVKNNHFKCLRCHYQRCKSANKICFICKNILKDQI